jgi:protein CpxP
MSDPNNSSPSANSQAQPARKRKPWLLITTTAVAAALTGAIATTALSQQGPPWRHGPMGGGYMDGGNMDGGFMGRGFMGRGFMGGPFHRGGPIDPEHAADRADRMMRHLAVEIDATNEQQDKLRSIVKTAVKDLVPMREKAHSARERARALLTAPTIDRAAIESFRADQIALADQASKRLAKALGDAAEVLTPEQRQKIEERMESRRSHWRPWHRG